MRRPRNVGQDPPSPRGSAVFPEAHLEKNCPPVTGEQRLQCKQAFNEQRSLQIEGLQNRATEQEKDKFYLKKA